MKKLTPNQEQLKEVIINNIDRYQRKVVSESIKRGITLKRLKNPDIKNFHDFIRKCELRNDILLFPMMGNEANKFAGKILNKKYLYRVFIGLTCNTEIQNLLNKAMSKAVKYALDDTDPVWGEIDKKYNKKGKKLSTVDVKNCKVY